MATDQWRQVQLLFERAVELAPTERTAFLADACGDDAELREEVESLLRCDQLASDRFMTPPKPDAGTAQLTELEDAAGLVGMEIGRYRIQRVIATGGMGTVYEALQEQPQRSVALKVMHRAVASNSALRRFQFESQVLARLHHKNVAQIYEAGVHEGEGGSLPYFAMEHVQGAKTITEYAGDHQLSTRQRLLMFATICDAVHHGHQKGIIHRDLKPANILVDESGEPKVIDFGVARSTDSDVTVATQHTRTGQLVGTMQYMSPEQCDADPDELDTRSDVYSLGVVLYELLAGEPPYVASGTAIYQAAKTIKESTPRRLSAISSKLRGDIDAVVLMALEKERERRYPSAADFADDLRRCASNQPVKARRPSTVYLLFKLAVHNKVATAAVCFWLTTLLGATVITAILAAEANKQKREVKVQRYEAVLVGSEAALRDNDPQTAQDLLLQVTEDERGWEWKHCWDRLDMSMMTVPDLGAEVRPSRIALRPDERLLAICLSNVPETALYDFDRGIMTERLRCSFPKVSRAVAAAFSADGTVLATAYEEPPPSRDCIIECRAFSEAGDCGPLCSWTVPAGDISGLAFHPQRRILASTGEDLMIWELDRDAAPIEPVVRVSLDSTMPMSSFSPDGTLLAVACGSAGEAQLWSVQRLLQGNETASARLGHDFHVLDVAFSPDGTQLASASMDKTIRLWDVNAIVEQHERSVEQGDHGPVCPQPVEILYGHTEGVTAVSFDVTGGLLVSGGYDRAIRVWEIEPSVHPTYRAGRYRSSLRGHSRAVEDILALSDGRVVSASPDGTVKVWDPDSQDVQRIGGFDSSVYAAAFTPDGHQIVAAGGHGTVVLWDVDAGSAHKLLTLSLAYHAADLCCWSRGDATYVAIAAGLVPGTFGHVSVWDLKNWSKPVWQYPTNEDSETISFQSIAVTSNGCYLAAGDYAGTIYVWNVSNLAAIGSPRVFAGAHAEPVNSVEFLDAEGKWLVSASGKPTDSTKHTIRLWKCSPANPNIELSGDYDEHTDAVTDLALSGDGTMLASASNDRTVCLWSVRWPSGCPRLVTETRLQGHTDGVTAVAFDPNGRRLATGSSDRTIKIWDTTTTRNVATLRGQEGIVLRLAFEPNGRRLISGSGGNQGTDNVVRIWDSGRQTTRKHSTD